MNERYALNAANARWMSLYDSLYGTDVIEQSEDSASQRYDPLRGEMVIKYGREFLDKYFKLENQNHIRLSVLERNFWKLIEADTDLHVGQARIGERITNLYLDGLIQNKDGYTLTKKGREQLAFAPWNRESVA